MYDANEAKAIAQAYLNMKCGTSNLDILLGKEVEKPDEFESDLRRLSLGEPLQYVTGKAYFL
ncbi:MAG: Peptide chain release factor N(5)-glutamine methyltransferase, partial [Bacteroidota bacterium]